MSIHNVDRVLRVNFVAQIITANQFGAFALWIIGTLRIGRFGGCIPTFARIVCIDFIDISTWLAICMISSTKLTFVFWWFWASDCCRRWIDQRQQNEKSHHKFKFHRRYVLLFRCPNRTVAISFPYSSIYIGFFLSQLTNNVMSNDDVVVKMPSKPVNTSSTGFCCIVHPSCAASMWRAYLDDSMQ